MKTLLLIDANSIIHRCFHALPELTTPKGEPIQAIYGLSSVLLKVLRESPSDYAAAAFDRKEKTFREEVFKEYKAHRPPTPPALTLQLEKARELFGIFNIKTLESAGFEADDIIGTLAEKFKKNKDLKIVILSGDLDNLQLVDKNVFVRTFVKGVSETVLYDEKAVEERYGLKPEQLTDYKGLVGDASDNIPGVPGIGPKTALPLIKTYGTLQNFYDRIKQIEIPETPKSKEEKLYKKLLEFETQALQSRDLVIIKRDVPLELGLLEELKWIEFDNEKLWEYFLSLGFKTLVRRIGGNPPASEVREQIAEDIPENFRTDIAYWLIDPDLKKYDKENLSKKFLKKEYEPSDDKALAAYALRKLKEYELEDIFNNMELPLVKTLSNMQERGIGVDVGYLKKLNLEADAEIREVEAAIYKAAGLKFNLNSPQQLAEVLFKRLGIGIKGVKKTKKGQLSTAFENLEALKKTHSVIPLILRYREIFKLKSTYIEPLIRFAEKDGRIHTTYVQTGTATGRLSSQEPNLQNIPTGSDWAKKIRNAFLADKGRSFIAFDYSQIELRILASLSEDKNMIEIFNRGEDIHTATAASIFDVPEEKITMEMRRTAKTLNFGIIYGMGEVSFAETSGLTRDEARKFIDEYFEKFSAVRKWQEKVKEEARTFGFVKNLNGRRRWLFDIVSNHRGLAAENERAAVNMPIQSLDADIMKMAMLELHKITGEKIRMLLTIHDELLFEIGDDIIKETIPKIRDKMESVYKLSVPLKVDVSVGKRWGEMEKWQKESGKK